MTLARADGTRDDNRPPATASGSGTESRNALPEPAYAAIGSLLTPTELSFFGVLKQAIGNKYDIHSKVRLADVLKPTSQPYTAAWQTAFNKIQSKHIDFVLCNPESMQIVKLVELNDSSHRRAHRSERDSFLEAACRSASVALLFVVAKQSYSVSELRKLLDN